MGQNKISRKTKNLKVIEKRSNKITFRTDPEIETAIKGLSDYLQIESVSEVVRQGILLSFKALKVREEVRRDLQKRADIYDLKVVDKHIRG